MLTYYLRNFWKDCKINSILKIQETLPDIDNKTLLKILEGEKKLLTEDGINYTLEDDYEENISNLSRDYIQESFEYKFMNLASQVRNYSKGIYINIDEDKEYYYTLLKQTFKEINEVENNWKLFCNLIECDINIRIEDYLDNEETLDSDELSSIISRYSNSSNKTISYKDAVSEYLSTLNFSYKYALDYLIKKKRYQTIELIKIDLSNGLKYIPEHEVAQSDVDTLRGDNIFPENILECIWNSGWLSPNGELYGCPDCDHINFSDRLVKYLNLSGTNSDRILETNGYIKFSCGRWLYMEKDFTPTIAQLETILKWNKEKNKSLKICIGDGLSMVNVDIIESKLNSLNK